MRHGIMNWLVAAGLALLLTGNAAANNIAVTNVVMAGQTNYAIWQVRFDISWENSWRCDTNPPQAPNNHDAAWVFLKWRAVSGSSASEWKHGTLSTNSVAHFAPTGCVLAVGLDGRPGAWGTTGVGAFLYRAAPGGGAFSNHVRLAWNYAADGAPGGGQIEMKVCAIEMVYVPEGAFYLGSGGGEVSHFYQYTVAGQTTQPYWVSSETNAITVGTTSGNLYYDAYTYGGDQTGTLSNAFPKGYGAFYCMKYEISQGQYADFLNTLTLTQAGNRWCTTTVASPPFRYAITNIGGVYSSTNPYVACNWLSWADGAAYADWAGLRPLTELEFEKVCRGTNTPVANEYAWGNMNITQATNIVNAGQASEAAQGAGGAVANCVYDNAAGVQGPMRAGCLGIGLGMRLETGAGYYGVMELSGNVNERTVTVGTNTGRAFMGQHGNGTLTVSLGDANVPDWPGTNAIGAGARGGHFWYGGAWARVSHRSSGANAYASRNFSDGWRAARSCPSGVGP